MSFVYSVSILEQCIYNALIEFKLYAYLKWPFTIIVSSKTVIIKMFINPVDMIEYRDILRARICDIFLSWFHCVQLEYTTNKQTSVLSDT